MSQIHFLLAHTMYKLLRLIKAIRTTLKFTQKSCVLGEKQKESIWWRKRLKTFRFPKKAAIDVISVYRRYCRPSAWWENHAHIQGMWHNQWVPTKTWIWSTWWAWSRWSRSSWQDAYSIHRCSGSDLGVRGSVTCVDTSLHHVCTILVFTTTSFCVYVRAGHSAPLQQPTLTPVDAKLWKSRKSPGMCLLDKNRIRRSQDRLSEISQVPDKARALYSCLHMERPVLKI